MQQNIELYCELWTGQILEPMMSKATMYDFSTLNMKEEFHNIYQALALV